MIDAPLGFAFAAGIVAAFNPCGFAMLPAYLSFYLGGEEGGDGGLLRALAVGAVVSLGFVGVFGVAGVLITQASLGVQSVAPWFTVVIGLALVPLGAAMLAGFEPKIALPRFGRATSGRGLGSMLVFGVSYAVVSLSCTLPVFLTAVATTFDRSNFVSGMAVFGAYALGMTLVLMVLTAGMGVARQSLVGHFRRVLPYVNRVSGALLVVAGAYVAFYGWVAIRENTGAPVGNPVVDLVGQASGRVTTWVQNTGPGRIGLGLGLVVVVAVVAALARRANGKRAAVPPGYNRR